MRSGLNPDPMYLIVMLRPNSEDVRFSLEVGKSSSTYLKQSLAI